MEVVILFDQRNKVLSIYQKKFMVYTVRILQKNKLFLQSSTFLGLGLLCGLILVSFNNDIILPMNITLILVSPTYLYLFSIVFVAVSELYYTPKHYQKWYEKHVKKNLDYPLITLIQNINPNNLDPTDFSSYNVIKAVMVAEVKGYIENTPIHSRFYISGYISFLEDFISKNEVQINYNQSLQILERSFRL
jgi:hypothetical protein